MDIQIIKEINIIDLNGSMLTKFKGCTDYKDCDCETFSEILNNLKNKNSNIHLSDIMQQSNTMSNKVCLTTTYLLHTPKNVDIQINNLEKI